MANWIFGNDAAALPSVLGAAQPDIFSQLRIQTDIIRAVSNDPLRAFQVHEGVSVISGVVAQLS